MVVVARKDKVLVQLPVGKDPRHLAVDERRGLVYVANSRDNSMRVTRRTEVITTLGTGGGAPTDIAVDERRGYVYVSNASGSVTVFGFDEEAEKPSN